MNFAHALLERPAAFIAAAVVLACALAATAALAVHVGIGSTVGSATVTPRPAAATFTAAGQTP